MTTTDKNRIIAQFMGLRPKLESPDVYSFSDSPWFVTRGSDPEKIMDDIANYAKYHSDWNWLMEVINRIEGIWIESETSQDTATVLIDGSFCQIYTNGTYINEIINIDGQKKIEAVHEAVYQFVVWNNQQVKETPKL